MRSPRIVLALVRGVPRIVLALVRGAAALGLTLVALRAPAGQTYFVATTGSDTNNGLTPVSAFLTIQKAGNVVGPGDRIRVRPGTYAGARLETSGTTNAPITLTADTPGTVVFNAPGAGNKHTSILEIETFSSPYVVRSWIIEGLRINNSPKYGIDARSTQFLTIRGNTVSNSVVTGIFTAFSYDVTIEGNTACYNGEHGIYINNSSDRFLIRANTLHHNANAGLHMNGDASIAPPDGTPWVGDGILSDGIVENNVIYLNGRGGAGINMDGVERTLVRNNLIYNTTNNSGIAMFQINGGVASRSNRLLNNTIIMAATGGWAINLADPACISNQVFNNLIYNFHPFRGSIVIAATPLEGFASDYNAVLGRFSIDNGNSTIGLAAWQALGYDQHSLVAAPAVLVVDPTNDLHLVTNSPAIDRGTARADVPFDREGTARPLDGNVDGTNAWDVGAYEFVNAQADSDHDGATDRSEQLSGTDATNPASYLAVTALDAPPGNPPTVAWPSVAGRHYAVDCATNLSAGFARVATNLAATPPINTQTVSAAASPAAFYRIAVEVP